MISIAYNRSIEVRRFQVGNMVLGKVLQNTKDAKDGKLDLNGIDLISSIQMQEKGRIG